MAQSTDDLTPTVKAIYEAYEKRSDDGNRPHLGASIIGKSCDRAIWYTFHWSSSKKFSGRMLRLFNRGHREEDRFVADLRSAGVTVYEWDDERTKKQHSISDFNGHFQGSLDGIGIGIKENPSHWHVLEFKTHSAKSFKDLIKNGVKEAKPEHYSQMQVYMHYKGLEFAYYLAVCKDDDDLHGEVVAYNAPHAQMMINRAERIIKANKPPEKISDNPSWFECKFCDHWDVCHGTKFPKRNCRTCTHSTSLMDGSWHCDKHKQALSIDDQREGCSNHLFNPFIVNLPVHDSGSDWVDYKMPDGTIWRDGK